MHGLLADFFANVFQRNLRGASDTIATKPTSGGQRNLFLTLHTFLPQKKVAASRARGPLSAG